MLPNKQGLYSPEFEHDNCGAGFICSLKGEKTNDIIFKALNILTCLEHRGAVSSDGKTGLIKQEKSAYGLPATCWSTSIARKPQLKP